MILCPRYAGKNKRNKSMLQIKRHRCHTIVRYAKEEFPKDQENILNARCSACNIRTQYGTRKCGTASTKRSETKFTTCTACECLKLSRIIHVPGEVSRILQGSDVVVYALSVCELEAITRVCRTHDRNAGLRTIEVTL